MATVRERANRQRARRERNHNERANHEPAHREPAHCERTAMESDVHNYNNLFQYNCHKRKK